MPASGRPRFEDFFTAVCRSSDGGLVVGGENNRGGWLLGTDAEGRTEWELDLEYPRDVVGDVVRTADGGAVATGRLYERDGPDQHTVTDSRSPSDLYLFRVDSGGSIRWLHPYNGGRNEAGAAVTRLHNGGILAVGGSFTHRDDDLFVARTDAAGDQAWTERFYFASDGGGSADEPWPIPLYGRDVAAVAPGKYVVAAGYLFLKVVATRSTPTATP